MPQDFDSPLLKEIRANFDYDSMMWREIYEEGDIDMRCVSGDPWEPKDKAARKKAGRLCLSFDEIGQYCNQVINDVRQNQRSVKVVPKGNGADDATALKRSDRIREIEYKSKAQAAIRTAFEGAVQRSFGFYKFKTQYVSDSAFEQELAYVRIPNPKTIYIDWEAKESDCSDMEHAFEFDTMPKRRFSSEYPNAEIQSFTPELAQYAPAWLKDDRVQVASYWKLLRDKDQLFLFANGEVEKLSVFKERYGKVKVGGNYLEIDGQTLQFLKKRSTESRQVKQYITNGLEILEENDWPGDAIPIIPVLGKELWVDEGGGAKRKLLSIVRLARDPLLAYCYYRTCQAEIAQQSPKAPYEGFQGQFDTGTDFTNIHKVPAGYVEFKLTTEESIATGAGALPMPKRTVFDATGIQALEISADACRAAIQAAVGATGMLNGTVKGEAKSGIALRTLNQQESQSNFHFIDNLDIALENGGRQLNHLLTKVEDSERTVGFRDAKGEHYTETVNQEINGQKVGFHFDQGEHDVQITTGPSFQSERAEAQDMTESILHMGDPVLVRALMPLVIKLRNLGPLGEEMSKIAEALSPLNQQQPQIPPAVQMQMQKMGALLQKLMQEKQAKTVELQGKAWIANAQQQVDLEKKRYDVIGQIAQAMIKAGQTTDIAQFESQMEQFNLQWEQAHEFGMGAAQAAHERALSQQEHQQALEQSQQSAAIAPQPQVQQ